MFLSICFESVEFLGKCSLPKRIIVLRACNSSLATTIRPWSEAHCHSIAKDDMLCVCVTQYGYIKHIVPFSVIASKRHLNSQTPSELASLQALQIMHID